MKVALKSPKSFRREVLKMRAVAIPLAVAGSCFFGLSAAHAEKGGACGQIKAACEQAGFSKGGGKSGAGLGKDCIQPIMEGKPQRKKATTPLPQIDPQIIADCKAKNPTFGQGGGGSKAAGKGPGMAPAAPADQGAPPPPNQPGQN